MLNILFTLLVGFMLAGGTLSTKLSATSGNLLQGHPKAVMWLLVAVCCYLSGYVGFYKLTERMDISLLSPSMQAISTVSVLLVSAVALQESLGPYKLTGIALICLGLLALGMDATSQS